MRAGFTNTVRLATAAVTLVALALLVVPRAAAEPKESESPQVGVAAEPGPRVAVLPFDAEDPGNPRLGDDLATTITALIADEPGLSLVDRERLERVLDEQALGQAGLVGEDAVRVGRLAGAELIVVGRAFPLGQSMMLAVKIIGVETSLVDAVLVRGRASEIDDMAVDAAAKIADKVRDEGGRLTGDEAEPADPLPALIQQLRSLEGKPSLAVVVLEEHVSSPQNPSPSIPDGDLDPVVETELKRSLIESGVEVFDVRQNQLADWADFQPSDVNSWPRELGRVDVLIVGEAYSETGLRIGQLVSASGRGEINMIDRETGRILLAERSNAKGVGVSPRQAGKEALTRVGRDLSAIVIDRLVEHIASNNQADPTTIKE
ncbi:MAG: CsgG/HfaB family protein [Planctomycetota bacterium]